MSDVAFPKRRTAAAKRERARPSIVGRATMAWINEMEGLVMTTDMRADFEAFDAAGLTNEQRRRFLVRKYGKPTR